MEKIISKLKEIKKEELSERDFFESVIEVLSEIDETNLDNIVSDEEEGKKLSEQLKDIGCVDWKTWVEEKEKKGEITDERRRYYASGIRYGTLEMAESMIDIFLDEKNWDKYDLYDKRMSGDVPFIKQWLKVSKELSGKVELLPEEMEIISKLKEIKKGELSENEFYGAVVKEIRKIEDLNDGLTARLYMQLNKTLKDIGCIDCKEKNSEIPNKDDFETSILEAAQYHIIAPMLSDDFVYAKNKFDENKIDEYCENWLDKLNKKETILKLKDIKKEELSEREFFESVINAIDGLDKLDSDFFEEFKATLKDIGCVDFNTWISEKEAKGEKINITTEKLFKGYNQGLIEIAEAQIINPLLSDNYNNAKVAFNSMKYQNLSKTWLENSEKLYGKDENSRETKSLERISDENEIKSGIEEKKRLEEMLEKLEKHIEAEKKITNEEGLGKDSEDKNLDD